MSFARVFNRFVSLGASLALLGAPALASAAADDRPSFIRDAEIEATIRAYATPLFEAADLAPDDVQVHLINDDQINAFVAGGQNLFMYTGLLTRTDNANQVIGVIAHETGHIRGGHLARMQQELENAMIESLAAMVLGIGAAVASGQPGVATTAIGAGTDMARRNLLSYSRTQEASADHAAMEFLDRTGQSTRGLLDFMRKLETQELILSGHQDPYVLTHPLTQARIDALEEHVAHSAMSDAREPAELEVMHQRMKAKLVGFLKPLGEVLRQYPEKDTSLAGRYARCIAYYRIANLGKALPMIDALLKEHPDDPYFLELKGQMLFENGRLAEALPNYRRAMQLKPDSALLRLELAQIEIELNRPELDKDALVQLREVTRKETRNAEAWRLLAIAYGRGGQLADAALSLAEQASALGQRKEARLQADRAMKQLAYGSPGYLRAQDILNENKRKDDEQP
ncbi:MAG: M48 family metalloprotease [Dongiaceae bacterium]